MIIVTTSTKKVWLNRDNERKVMSVEMGSTTCLHLMESKSHIEAAMVGVAHLEDAESLRHQLRCIHRQLEGMHEMERMLAASRRTEVEGVKPRPVR